MSAIKLEKNGRNSCTGNSRHVDIRYFFVKDRVDSGNIEILYCPTEDMLADFFTKCLQGSLFRKFRDIVMGYTSIHDIVNKAINKTTDKQESSKVKEHVGILKNTGKVTFENIETKNKIEANKEKNNINGTKKKNLESRNISHNETSPLILGSSNRNTVRSTVGPRSAILRPISTLGTKNWSTDRTETYAEVLKHGKVKEISLT